MQLLKHVKILLAFLVLAGCSSSAIQGKSNENTRTGVAGTWKIEAVEHDNTYYQYGKELKNFSFLGPTTWSKAIDKVFVFDENFAKSDIMMINEDSLLFRYSMTKEQIVFSIKNPKIPDTTYQKAFVVKLNSLSDTDMVWELDSVIKVNLKKL